MAFFYEFNICRCYVNYNERSLENYESKTFDAMLTPDDLGWVNGFGSTSSYVLYRG